MKLHIITSAHVEMTRVSPSRAMDNHKLTERTKKKETNKRRGGGGAGGRRGQIWPSGAAWRISDPPPRRTAPGGGGFLTDRPIWRGGEGGRERAVKGEEGGIKGSKGRERGDIILWLSFFSPLDFRRG